MVVAALVVFFAEGWAAMWLPPGGMEERRHVPVSGLMDEKPDSSEAAKARG